MKGATSSKGGTTFSVRCSVREMDSGSSFTIQPEHAEALLQDFVGGERGRALRAQLASRHSERSSEEIEDAVQTACERFVKVAEGITDQAEVYI